MKRKLLIGIGAICLFAIVAIAGVGDILNNVKRTDELDKATRDTLLQASNADKINITIDIKCETDGYPDKCKWSAFQAGLINSRDNIVSRWKNETVAKTTEEVTDEVQAKIKTRLENYAGAIKERKEYTKTVDGNIIFNEKK